MNKFLIITLCFLLMIFTSGCSHRPIDSVDKIHAPLGLYKSNSTEKFWLALLSNEQYMICNPSECNLGIYERVFVDHGVILLDFYKTKIGHSLEKFIHGANKSSEFLAAMKALRLQQARPDDQVFNMAFCGETPCVTFGHGRDGIQFYQVENFDSFWKKTN